MLTGIRRVGYKIGLISNCSHDEMITFQESELHSLIDVSVLSCEVGLKKPDIQIYGLCARCLQLQPSDCIYVGDGGELDGASDAGMSAYQAKWFTRVHKEYYKSVAGYTALETPNDVLRLISAEEST